MEQPVLQLQGVSKRFGRFQALKDVDLTVNAGDIFALIGENGAGKTTIMRLVVGLSPMGQGQITLLGEHAGHYRHALSRIGAVIETPTAFENLTVTQNLKVIAIQHGLSDGDLIAKTISLVGLTEKAKTKAKHLSLGLRQRLGLAIAVLAQPDFVILDEPTNGLDPMGIVQFRSLVKRLQSEFNTTILISSHILTELYQVATKFAFLHRGQILQVLTKSELDERTRGGLELTVSDAAHAAEVLDEAGLKQLQVRDDSHVVLQNLTQPSEQVNELLVKAGVSVIGMTRKEATLEQYYTQLIQAQGAGQ